MVILRTYTGIPYVSLRRLRFRNGVGIRGRNAAVLHLCTEYVLYSTSSVFAEWIGELLEND